MAISQNEFDKLCSVQTEEFAIGVLEAIGAKNNIVKLRELTIAEDNKAKEILKDTKNKNAHIDMIYFRCKCSMVEPKFFSEATIKKLNANAQPLIFEIFSRIALIGKTKEQKEEYDKLIISQLDDLSTKKEPTKKELEKK